MRPTLRALLGGLFVGLAGVCAPAQPLYWQSTGSELLEQQRATSNCWQHVAQIMQAAETWAMDNVDQPPASLQEVTNELGNASVLFCPGRFRESLPTTNWDEVDWAAIDYTWNPQGWDNPTNLACLCRVHVAAARVDGSVLQAGFPQGWPLITAPSAAAFASPGQTVRFELKVAPDTLKPLSFQWRRVHPEYLTNVYEFPDPNDARRTCYGTNIVTWYSGTNLSAETNAVLVLAPAQTSDSGCYTVVISNQMGVSSSHPATLRVDESLADAITNAVWIDASCSNNLYQIWLLARVWQRDHHSPLPQSFSEMTNSWNEPIFGWPQLLFCPGDTNRAAPAEWSQVDFGDTSYELLPTDGANAFEIFCQCRTHKYYISIGGEAMLRPYFNWLQPRPGGAVEVSFRVFLSRENVLERSTDLVNWTPLASYVWDTGDVQCYDGQELRARFYRLRLP